MSLAGTVRGWARRVKLDAIALWFAYRNPATPWLPKLLCGVVVAYALSPIDLIPDFIPVLGYLDDLLLLPGLIWLAVKLMPPSVMTDGRAKASRWMEERRATPRSHAGAAAIVVVWLGIAFATGVWLYRHR